MSHPHPNTEHPTFIRNLPLDPGTCLCRIDRTENPRLSRIKGDSLACAGGSVVQPGGAVMPDEGVKASEVIGSRIDEGRL